MEKSFVRLELLVSFVVVLIQVSFGAFFVLVLGDIANVFGLEASNYFMAIWSALPLFLALMFSGFFLLYKKYMKFRMLVIYLNAVYMVFVALSVSAYHLDLHIVLRSYLELITLICGFFVIVQQAWIHPKKKSVLSFFFSGYIGVNFLAFFAMIFSMQDILTSLLILGLFLALVQAFLFLEGRKDLENGGFKDLSDKRFLFLVLGGLFLPLVVVFLYSYEYMFEAVMALFFALLLSFVSELIEKYVLYIKLGGR